MMLSEKMSGGRIQEGSQSRAHEMLGIRTSQSHCSSYHNDRPFCNGLVYTFVWSNHLHADVPNHGSRNKSPILYCARLLAVIQPFALMCFVFYLFWTNRVTGVLRDIT